MFEDTQTAHLVLYPVKASKYGNPQKMHCIILIDWIGAGVLFSVYTPNYTHTPVILSAPENAWGTPRRISSFYCSF